MPCSRASSGGLFLIAVPVLGCRLIMLGVLMVGFIMHNPSARCQPCVKSAEPFVGRATVSSYSRKFSALSKKKCWHSEM